MLGKLIGKGSDGEVYEILNNDNLVVKYIQPNICGIENYLEYYIMLHSKHENIVKAESITRSDHKLIKIVQKRAVSNLCRRIKNKRNVFRQMVEGLLYISARGIIHGDIKPSNILLYRDDMVKLNDFSLCRFLESDSTKQLYTYHYRPPEIDKGFKSLKSDVYALGCSMYEIYFNEPYHDKRYSTRIHIKKKPVVNNKDFLDLIYNMTEEDLDKRFSISQVCKHKYFSKTEFSKFSPPENKPIEFLYSGKDHPLFLSKCMNETLNICIDYEYIDNYVSKSLNFKILDIF